MTASPNGAADVAAEFRALHSDVRAALESAGVKTAGLSHRMDDLEQRIARGTGGGPPATKSWGEQFAESDGLKAFRENTSRPSRYRMEFKTTITAGSSSGGPLVPVDRDMVTIMPRRRLRVRDLLPVVQISGGTVEYPRQTTRTNNAATVAEAAAKPESAYAFELVSVAARVIAHWVPASRQILDDAPQLRDIINGELLYGLGLKEETQLLLGDGTGQNLYGLVPQATAYSAPFSISSPTILDTLGLAVLQAALTDFEPDGIVLHPSDWMRARLLKDSEGRYILGAPGQEVAPMLFGLPVVATQSMTIDKFLVGSFRSAGTIYDRWTPRVEISTEHDDYFTKNLVAILAEERLGLGVKQPTALIFGDLGFLS